MLPGGVQSYTTTTTSPDDTDGSDSSITTAIPGSSPATAGDSSGLMVILAGLGLVIVGVLHFHIRKRRRDSLRSRKDSMDSDIIMTGGMESMNSFEEDEVVSQRESAAEAEAKPNDIPRSSGMS